MRISYCFCGLFIFTSFVFVCQSGPIPADRFFAKESALKSCKELFSPSLSHFFSESAFSGSCIACRIFAEFLHELLVKNETKELIVKVIICGCDLLHLHNIDQTVCQAIVSEFQDQVLFLASKLIISPDQICGSIVPNCGEPYKWQYKWSLQIPNETSSVSMQVVGPAPKNASTLRVLHLTDVHWDPKYRIGAEADCGEPQCCRIIPPDGKVKKPAGKWGTLASCDLPLHTIEHSFQYISQTEKFDYIIFTGDIPSHDVWNQSRSDQLMAIRTVIQLLRKYFPETPIFPALGNHEGAPVNMFPPHYPNLPLRYSIDWLYAELAENWTTLMHNSSDLHDVIRHRASYSVLLHPGYRIISVNTNYANWENTWIMLNQTDPDQTLQWLIDELVKAESEGEKVHIISHIPTVQCMASWSAVYFDIMYRFRNTVVANFMGHTHFDHYKLYFDDADPDKAAFGVQFISPSLVTFSVLNPAFKIYTIDGFRPGSTWNVLDAEKYAMRLDKMGPDGDPIWEKAYKFTEEFGVENMFPTAMRDLIMNKLPHSRRLMTKYYKYYYSMAPQSTPITDEILNEMLCDMRQSKAEMDTKCQNPIIHFDD